jgi:hypothetical protein
MGLYGQVNIGGGAFLKLVPEKMTRLRILDYPFVSSQVFEGDGEKNVSTKFTWEVYDYDSGEVKLLSKGASVFNQIRDITELQGEDLPAPFDIGVKVTGTGMNTRYSVNSAPLLKPLPSDLKRIDVTKIIDNAIPLLEFSQGGQPKLQSKSDSYASSADDLNDEPLPEAPEDMGWPN